MGASESGLAGCSCSEDQSEDTSVETSGQTFEQVMSGSTLKGVRSARAALVRKSEALFLDEFSAVLRNGVRVEHEGRSVTLTLARDRLEWGAGHLALADVVKASHADCCVFVETATDVLAFDADENLPDLACLLADGLRMLAKRYQPPNRNRGRRAERARLQRSETFPNDGSLSVNRSLSPKHQPSSPVASSKENLPPPRAVVAPIRC
mmetsp:Transcript_16595/g.50250  ORF Transcript_16595/g.50250 Transcript_16595/m.50250 type:complete len:208 (+) Transcript_16595:411-1034(+)